MSTVRCVNWLSVLSITYVGTVLTYVLLVICRKLKGIDFHVLTG